MTKLKWWLRIIGVFYLLQFVVIAVLKAPIRAQGPAGALEKALAGDPLARFLVDTWVTFGLEVGAIGVALVIASRYADRAKALAWAVIGIEFSRGIVADLYMLARGQERTILIVWMVIHTVVIVTGLLSLRSSPSGQKAALP